VGCLFLDRFSGVLLRTSLIVILSEAKDLGEGDPKHLKCFHFLGFPTQILRFAQDDNGRELWSGPAMCQEAQRADVPQPRATPGATLDDRELLLPFSEFPWFRSAPVGVILDVERPQPHRLYWPQLDVDLAVESIERPERYPLISKASA
jgi:hypothetical protein